LGSGRVGWVVDLAGGGGDEITSSVEWIGDLFDLLNRPLDGLIERAEKNFVVNQNIACNLFLGLVIIPTLRADKWWE
jgi:hypothetical protein